MCLQEDGERNGIPLGAEEEVGSSQNSSDGTQTLVLMDPDGQGNSVIYDMATGIITEQVIDNMNHRTYYCFMVYNDECSVKKTSN